MDWSNALSNIIGNMLAGSIGYLSARRISSRNAKDIALAKLRAVFAPTLAKIRLFEDDSIGHSDYAEVFSFLKDQLLQHAAAIEEFRSFSGKNEAKYEKAWRCYQDKIKEFRIPDAISSQSLSKEAVLEGIKVCHRKPVSAQDNIEDLYDNLNRINPIKDFLTEIKEKIESLLNVASGK
jgi:hypothetical protein